MSTQLDIFQIVPLDKLTTSEDNVRQDAGDVQDLAASIAAVGVLEPLVVVATDEGFEVVAGGRRLAAAREAGLHDVPVVVRDLDVAARVEASIVENLQRKDLDPLDEARGYRRLVELGWQQSTIAERVGVSAAHVSRRLALLRLPDDVQKKVEKGALPLEDAYALTQLVDHPKELAEVVKEKTKNGYVATHRLVDGALRRIKIEEKRAPVIDKLKARGIRVLGGTSLAYGRQKYCAGTSDGFGGHYTISLNSKDHAKQFASCHAALVDEAAKVRYVCTNPSAHEKKSGSKKTASKSVDKAKEKREAEAAAWKLADEQRDAFVASLLKGKFAAKDVLELLLRTSLDLSGETSTAAQWLDPEATKGFKPFSTQADEFLLEYAAKGERQLLAAAAALAIAMGAAEMRYADLRGGSAEVGTLRWLVARGYTPADVERQLLSKADAKAKKGAKADA